MTCSCDDFKKACQSGTDNEEYGALFSVDNAGAWEVGSRLRAPRYCPWCGKELPGTDEQIREGLREILTGKPEGHG